MEERWKECGGGCEVWMKGGSSEGGWKEMKVVRWEVVEKGWEAGGCWREIQNKTYDNSLQLPC